MKRAGIAIVLLCAGCALEDPIYLDLSSRYPLACVEAPGPSPVPVVLRAFSAEHRDEDVLYVFDVIRTGGEIAARCPALRLRAHCAEHSCEAIPEARRCVRIPRARIEQVVASTAAEEITVGSFIEGMPELLTDAPEGPLIVRLSIVLSGEGRNPCDVPERLDRFDSSLLLGCGYTCPTLLTGEPPILSIDFDPLTAGVACTAAVLEECTGLGLR